MSLSKAGKRWLIVAAIPFILVLVAVIAVKIYFTSDRLKALIIPEIEEATRRTVQIRNISLAVFPSIAVEVDDLILSNPSGTKFSREEFLMLDRLTLKMKLFELIGGKADITEVILDHPILFLEKAPSGAKNYSSTPTRNEKGAPGEAQKSAGGALLLSHCEIRNGEIHYFDRQYDGRFMMTGWRQTIQAEMAAGENIIRAEGSASIEKMSYGSLSSWYIADQPLSGDLKLSYDMRKDVLSFDKCSAKLKDLGLSLTGTIANIKEDIMIMDLVVDAPGAGMEQLLSIIPPEMLKKTSGLQSTGEVALTLRIKGPFSDAMNPGASGTFTIANGSVKYSALPKSITNINLRGSFDRPSAKIGATGIGSFAIDKFSASLGGDEVGGALAVTNFSDPNLTASFNVALNLAEVKNYYPLEQGSELSGKMKLGARLEGKAKNPSGLKASGTAEFQDVTIQSAGGSAPLRHLNGTIAFNNQVIESKQLSMTIGESDLALGFTMKNYLGFVMPGAEATGTPAAKLTLHSTQLRTIDLMGEGKSASATKPAGSDHSKKSGMFPPIDMDANVEIGKLVTEKFTFTNMKGAIAISGGVVNLKNVNLNAFQGSIQANGTLDLRDPEKRPFDLGLNIASVESNELLSKFSSFGQYLFGKFSTTTKIKGDLDDTLGINTSTLLGNGNVQISEGKLAGLPLTTKLADMTGVNELREVNFSNWTNAFAIENGRIQVKDLKVNAGSTDFAMGGSQGLDGSLEYALTVKLPGSVGDRLSIGGTAKELLDLFKDKEGRYNLNFDVSGTSTSPVLKLNARAQEDAAKHKLEDELKKKAQEGLMKLFKRP